MLIEALEKTFAFNSLFMRFHHRHDKKEEGQRSRLSILSSWDSEEEEMFRSLQRPLELSILSSWDSVVLARSAWRVKPRAEGSFNSLFMRFLRRTMIQSTERMGALSILSSWDSRATRTPICPRALAFNSLFMRFRAPRGGDRYNRWIFQFSLHEIRSSELSMSQLLPAFNSLFMRFSIDHVLWWSKL